MLTRQGTISDLSPHYLYRYSSPPYKWQNLEEPSGLRKSECLPELLSVLLLLLLPIRLVHNGSEDSLFLLLPPHVSRRSEVKQPQAVPQHRSCSSVGPLGNLPEHRRTTLVLHPLFQIRLHSLQGKSWFFPLVSKVLRHSRPYSWLVFWKLSTLQIIQKKPHPCCPL